MTDEPPMSHTHGDHASQPASPKEQPSVDVKAHADRLFQFPDAEAGKEAHEEAGRSATLLTQASMSS